MKNYKDIYEPLKVYNCKLLCDKQKIKYKAQSSLHSVVTDWAYGKIIEKDCFDISDGTVLKAYAMLNDTIDKRFKIKLNACLLDWEKYSNDLLLKINGQIVYNGKVFLENVNLGWPSVYFNVPNNFVINGENVIEIFTANTSEGGLLVANVDILQLHDVKEYQQISIKKHVEKGRKFSVAILNEKHNYKGCVDIAFAEMIGQKYFDDICVLSFVAKDYGKCSASAVFGDEKIDLDMPVVVENSDTFLIGTDSDDHRHDDSEEFHRIMHTAIFSDMLNFLQFRPKKYRNYIDIADNSEFLKYTELMDLFGIKYGVVDSNKELEFLPKARPDNFYGYHVHEPYHFFNVGLEKLTFFTAKDQPFNFEGLRNSQSFSESKELFKDYLEKMRKSFSGNIGLTSVGSPSLLCVYEGDAGFDRITIEPVSNVNILMGAVRATDVKIWGAHIPTDWYYGVPVDSVKSAKFRLSLQYLYLNGATYVYAENALFKTNAFDRLDYEDEHLVENRRILKEFYHYTKTHPRKGKMIVDKAIVYGRNDFIMWQTNDRMGELKKDDWDTKMWGKWDNDCQNCWQSAKAWMPISDKQNVVKTPLNTKLFAGSPYGSVDVVYAEKDFSSYKTIAFLGWNTMDENLFLRLTDYVKDGGNLIISYCHFNTVDRNDVDMQFIDNEKISKLVGLTFNGEYIPERRVDFYDGASYLVEDDVCCVCCQPTSAKILCRDANGNGLIYKNQLGLGNVYFCCFKDYFSKPWAIDTVAHLLEIVGNDGIIKCNNKNVSFTVRQLDEGKLKIDMLNMNCLPDAKEYFVLTVGDKEIADSIDVGEIKEYVI